MIHDYEFTITPLNPHGRTIDYRRYRTLDIQCYDGIRRVSAVVETEDVVVAAQIVNWQPYGRDAKTYT